uniref:Tigger transposable element-derived protein 2 n=1 Tax=Lygus hesperus TaxID=30085 RepID=A0A0A9YD57_LYGHE
MVCGNGAGELAPIYVTYKSLNVYPEWVEGGPAHARYSRSKSGWFDTHTFEDWFEFTMLPILRRQAGTKVLIGDNLSSHISVRVLNLCAQHNVRFIALPPNSTHILQPLDVGFFGPLKKVWRKVLNDWKKSPRGRQFNSLPKSEFPKMLKKLLEEMGPKIEDDLKGGFKGAGIQPLDRQNVLKRLCQNRLDVDVLRNVSQVFIDELQASRSQITEKPQRRRNRKVNVPPGKGITAEDVQPAPNDRTSQNAMPQASTSTATQNDEPEPSTSRKRSRKNPSNQKKKPRHEESEIEDLSESDIPYADDSDISLEAFLREREDSDDENNLDDLETEGVIIDEVRIEENVESNVNVEIEQPTTSDGNFVVAKYCGKLYPGRRLSDPDEIGEVPVSAMVKKDSCWTWPSPPDILWYRQDKIIKTINPPKQIGQNLFKVEFNF